MPRIRVTVTPLEDRHNFVKLCDRAAIITQTLKRAGKGGRKAKTVAGYIGFNSVNEAIRICQQIQNQYRGAYVQVRPAQRLTACTHEVKIRHESVETIVSDYAKSLETTSQKIERHLSLVRNRPSIAPEVPAARYSAPISN